MTSASNPTPSEQEKRKPCRKCYGNGTVRETITGPWLRAHLSVRCPRCRGARYEKESP